AGLGDGCVHGRGSRFVSGACRGMNRSLEGIPTGTPVLEVPTRAPQSRRRFSGSAPRLRVLSAFGTRRHGPLMRQRFRVLKAFMETRPDVSVIFPVHPNPAVREAAEAELGGVPNVHLTAPMTYTDFLHCLAASWVIVSDSGGVQEEAPSLGKPLLIIRPDTERPEVVECGVARLVGQSLEQFERELEALDATEAWIESVGPTVNPFGAGDTAQRIVSTLVRWKAKALAGGVVR
ncbi:MAG: UDP-N-acetylglucosamine 2-epimerase, partial [Pseudomonadota bacterium]